MKYLDKAVKLAIDGGLGGQYPYDGNLTVHTSTFEYQLTDTDGDSDDWNVFHLLCRADFWKSLGVALRWARFHDHEFDDDGIVTIPEWHYQMLQCMDHLAQEKNLELFFKEIL